MWNKFGLKVLAVSIALVLVVSSVAMYGHSGTEGEKGISEGGGGRGVISLMPPPFIGVAGAAEAVGGGGGAAAAGTTFLEEEAGISAYVNVGQEIDLEKAKTAFKSIETANETYIIGQIALDGYDPEYVAPHAYVHKDGWIVTYYLKNEPSGKTMQWNGYDGGTITTTTLADTVKKVCDAIMFNYDTIKDDVKYYDFEYPNANRMILITEWIEGRCVSDTFNLTIPSKCELFEASWSHYYHPLESAYLPYDYSRVKITDEDYYPIYTVSELTGVHDVTSYKYYGIFTPEQLSADDILHIIIVEHCDNWGSAESCVAIVLIYRTS